MRSTTPRPTAVVSFQFKFQNIDQKTISVEKKRRWRHKDRTISKDTSQIVVARVGNEKISSRSYRPAETNNPRHFVFNTATAAPTMAKGFGICQFSPIGFPLSLHARVCEVLGDVDQPGNTTYPANASRDKVAANNVPQNRCIVRLDRPDHLIQGEVGRFCLIIASFVLGFIKYYTHRLVG